MAIVEMYGSHILYAMDDGTYSVDGHIIKDVFGKPILSGVLAADSLLNYYGKMGKTNSILMAIDNEEINNETEFYQLYMDDQWQHLTEPLSLRPSQTIIKAPLAKQIFGDVFEYSAGSAPPEVVDMTVWVGKNDNIIIEFSEEVVFGGETISLRTNNTNQFDNIDIVVVIKSNLLIVDPVPVLPPGATLLLAIGDSALRGVSGIYNHDYTTSIFVDTLYGSKQTGVSVTDVEEPNTLYGSKSNDTLDGFWDYDIIDGGDGLDTAKYSEASDAVSFSVDNEGLLVVQNTAGLSIGMRKGHGDKRAEGETLVSIERIQFSDKNYALDLDGNAGVAAKAVITCFGQDSLDLYMTAALTLADGGSTLDEICELVASMGYIESIKGISTNSSFVDFIFENVVGRAPNFLESSMYTGYLDDGVYTKGSLLTLAAGTELVGKQLTESAVDLIGVAGSADGEILALQYDLGLG
jgi:hypothetical protein